MQDAVDLSKEIDEEFERTFEYYVLTETLGSGIQLELLKVMAARFYRRGYSFAHSKAIQAASELLRNTERRNLDHHRW